MLEKLIVLDMDGTLADLYSVPDWHECLYDTLDARPYIDAAPIHNMNLLNAVLLALREQGWKIIINTWLSRTDTGDFHEKIKSNKLAWLERYEVPYDEIIMTKYGIDKYNTVMKTHPGALAVLVDDSEEVRASWKGYSIDGSKNVITKLAGLLLEPAYDIAR